MKNKNGFIATSIMFSFFLVFILLAMLVLSSYTHYYTLITKLNGSILDNLNDEVISKKYSGLRNVVTNGKADNGSSWSMNNSKVESVDNSTYIKLENGPGSSFSQSFNGKLTTGNNRKIYVAFNFQRNYTVTKCENEDFNVALTIGSTNYNSSNFTYYTDSFKSLPRKSLACGDWINWTIFGQIYTVNVNSNTQRITFGTTNIRYSGINGIGINNIIVVDVTNLYKNGTTDAQMVQYLIKNLPYFDSNYSLPKI